MKITKDKRQYLLLGLVFVILGFLGKIIYRTIIYANHIYDFGIADSLPSFFYVIGFSFLLMINRVIKPNLIIIIVTIGSVLYEFYQFWLTDIFDLSDVIFSTLGGILAISIYSILKRKTGYIKE